MASTITRKNFLIQIQHLLKLNGFFIKDNAFNLINSNTTLVKVK